MRRPTHRKSFTYLASRVVHAIRGANLTKKARLSTVNCLDRSLASVGAEHTRLEQLGLTEVQNFVGWLRGRGASYRTIHNHLSNLRVLLRGVGRDQFVYQQLSSASLGLKPGSRIGTHEPIPHDRYHEALTAAQSLDAGLAAALRLCRHLGLRGQEAVMAADDLPRWLTAIEVGGDVVISRGTKGRRLRTVPVSQLPDRAAARHAIMQAIAVTRDRKGVLIASPSGLKGAVSRYTRLCTTIGLVGKFSPHSLRYRYAGDLYWLLRSQGYDRNAACRIVSQHLGHGDGMERTRWTRMVYLRHALSQEDEQLRAKNDVAGENMPQLCSTACPPKSPPCPEPQTRSPVAAVQEQLQCPVDQRSVDSAESAKPRSIQWDADERPEVATQSLRELPAKVDMDGRQRAVRIRPAKSP
jgi:integrase